MHQSIATIDSPEFINLQPLELNPLMSSCEIKVLYVGENRNRSYITKEVATEMSKTLRGAPIVGYYRTDKEDFADHGEKITFDDQGVHFECMTKPYGFVAPDAKVWFQKFEDYDDFGNSTVREYLMTTGFLWTGQFEECQSVVETGKPHSMELDQNTLDGKWSTNTKTGMDFFIINDAIFSKLCILGDDVEPCFEGSSITAPGASNTFSLDNNFKNTLFNMMQDLKNFALQGGGKQMNSLNNTEGNASQIESVTSDFQKNQDKSDEVNTQKNQNFTEGSSSAGELSPSFKKDDEEEKNIEGNTSETSKPKTEDESKKDKDEDKNDDKEKKPSTKHTVADEPDFIELQNKFSALQTEYSNLKTHFDELASFKQNIEDKEKDSLIKSFYMLSEEDKKDVIENKSKYSYDEIKSKLSVICFDKKVNFDLGNTSKNDNTIEETPIVTFNLDSTESSVPAFVSALKNARKSKNN